MPASVTRRRIATEGNQAEFRCAGGVSSYIDAMKALHLSLLILASLVSLASTAPCQRPKSAQEAVAAFEKVSGGQERNRHRAIRDLGRFDEQAATDVLLAELSRAQSISYIRTVIRAIGYKQRPGTAAPLATALRNATNPRLIEAAAEALRKQGDKGIKALIELLEADDATWSRRNSICYSLGRLADGDFARDALLAILQRANSSEQLPALRGLASRSDDAAVDAMRVSLASHKNLILASTALQQLATHKHAEAPGLALDFAQRLPATADADLHTAVMQGLLTKPTTDNYGTLLAAAARAEDPFGKKNQAAWQTAFDDGTLISWLAQNGPTRKQTIERIAAARAARWTPKSQTDPAATFLRGLLSQRDAMLVQAASSSLIAVDQSKATETSLRALLKKAQKETAPIALGALHQLLAEDPAWQQQLLSLAESKRASIRSAALRALTDAKASPADKVEAASKNLAAREWSVRAAAIELLVASRTKEAPPLLMAMLDKEVARMQEDVRTALRNLTGLQFATKREWLQWWAKEGATFEPRKKSAATPRRSDNNRTVSYWNIPVRSERCTFVIDASGSMAQPFGTGSGTRLDEAKRQLGRVFETLPKKSKINVITFAGGTTPLFKKLSSLGKKQRKAATVFVTEMRSKGPTNVHDALAAAFADQDIDTIFLLTDGRPSVGPIVDPGQLADEIKRWNLSRSIRIHTIAIGEKSDFLARLAKDSGGQHSVAR